MFSANFCFALRALIVFSILILILGRFNFKPINFTKIIKKQLNHLTNEIENTEFVNDKMIGCSAIIMGGLCFKHQMQYLNIGSVSYTHLTLPTNREV